MMRDRRFTFLDLRSRATTRVVAVLLLALQAGFVPALGHDDGTAGTGGQKKAARFAPDLVAYLENAPADGRVRVITTLSDPDAVAVADRIKQATGGNVRKTLTRVRELVIEIPAAEVPHLAGVAGIDYVVPDRQVLALASHLQVTTGASQVHPPAWGEPLSSFLVSGGLKGYDGAGIGVAVVDSGIDHDHFDLRDGGRRSVTLVVDLVGDGAATDPYGHGTHVAGIIAGNGSSWNDSGRTYAGIAPKAGLMNLRVLDGRGRGYLSDVVEAIDIAIANRQLFGIQVINLSLAAPPVESHRDDPLCQAAGRAVAAGMVVVASAGNFGLDAEGREVYGGITSPGICPQAITVGSVITGGTDSRSDDRIGVFSSRGPARALATDPLTGAVLHEDRAKPDLVAPGRKIVSLERADNYLVRNHPSLHVEPGGSNNKSRYMMLTGTSMAAAAVSGTAALILQANRSLSPNLVKAILMYSAQRIEGADLFQQGAGLLNVEGAMRLARALRQDAGAVPVGQSLLADRLPYPASTIAGDTVPWGAGVAWDRGFVGGPQVLAVQQPAYAQTLIWGDAAEAWGYGASYRDGMYSETHVAYARYGAWRDVVWDSGTIVGAGLLFYDDLAATGTAWQASPVSDAFFTLDPATLIWDYARDMTLIWGDRAADQTLIWIAYDQTLIWDQALIWGEY